MRDLDLTSLRLFVTVCDTGNMSRAAEKANMVASAVSKRLAQLEATVGSTLTDPAQTRHGADRGGRDPAGARPQHAVERQPH
jgi:hypothetical protein